MNVKLITPATEPMIPDKREARRARKSGIYQILCIPTGKVYIGSAVWLAKRKSHHKEALLKGKHHSIYLQRAWDKYGKYAFVYSILEYCEKEKLTELEQRYIDILKASERDYGFNMQPKAHSNLGMTYGQETRNKISAARKIKGGTLTPVQIEELRERMKGNRFSAGIKYSPEVRERMKEKRKGKRPALGMRHTDEAKKKMSEKRRGVILSLEHRTKISDAHKGKKQTIEHRQRLALVQSKIKPEQFGKIKSEYTNGIITMKELAARYGCCAQTICNVINDKRMVC